MTSTGAQTALPDATERERAATTFDRNVVVTAGAGTGKTTLLVDRLVHLLMREPDPLAITQIVALTFTNKAADEMRVRLRERLQSYVSTRLDEEPVGDEAIKIHADLASLIRRYHLSKDEIHRRAREALRQIERGYLGTLHSFAALLLRLYPVEAGVDPQFKEDDGSSFKKHFDEQWSLWLDRQLGRQGGRHDIWRQVLQKISLETLRDLAFSLCSEIIPLAPLVEASNGNAFEGVLQNWLQDLERDCRRLIEFYPEDRHQIDRFLRYSAAILQQFSQRGEGLPNPWDQERRWFGQKTLRRAGNWSEEDFVKLQGLCRVARSLLLVDEKLTETLWQLLVPFAEECRQDFTRQGFVSFDGLLVRARNLLRDHGPLREELKYLFKAILIDEFQDTDPIQYEILLYLAEKPGKGARDWRAVELQPGKIFVVGDPKQSIYAFRRADIQAYLDVVRQVILAQGGIECALTANFRSHSAILDVVNGIFEPLIRERQALQPAYVPIQAPASEDPKLDSVDKAPFRKVTLRKIESRETLKALSARRLEAESLARWLSDQVLGKVKIRDRQGQWLAVQPKHVAFLFRKLSEVHLYLEPLRRRGIPYVVEGEKHFYATQEIVDAVNLLRAVVNPYDQAALVGLLRSPVGGLSDPEIYDLQQQHALDYRSVKRNREVSEKRLDSVQALYETLDRLHAESRTLSVAEAVKRIFETVPIRILAAGSFNGEQAVANLEKVRQQAALMGRTGLATLKDVIAQLERRVLEVEEESESALAEESVDAVKILSIHKAKGLEFAVVVLPDARAATGPRSYENGIQHDWSSGLIGLRAAGHLNLAGIYLDEKRRIREEEEEKRLFYVAMTRAREHLLISYPPLEVDKGSFVMMLGKSAGSLSSIGATTELTVGAGTIEFTPVHEKPEAPGRIPSPRSEKAPAPRGDWRRFAEQWRVRTKRYEAARRLPMFVSPTSLKRREMELSEPFNIRPGVTAETDALLIGNLAHGFLERLDFSAKAQFQEQLTRYLEDQPDGLTETSARARILMELREIFSVFCGSRAFAELASAKILGREIPLLMPWDGQIMEGVIDLLYERKGLLYLADYKSERIERHDLSRAAHRYRHQAEIYSRAVQLSLQREVTAFKLIFLRLGEMIEIKPSSRQGELFLA
jgi:ATP-dependent helicase/nuclease subunit A